MILMTSRASCQLEFLLILRTRLEGQDLNASNEEKNTALHWACLNGHSEVVKRLILAGASLCALNSHERTPMDEAVTRGKTDVIDAINAAVAQLELAGVTVS
ncbi:Ankyrin repeat-containing protein P16F5.05c [Linum grandiflorum]